MDLPLAKPPWTRIGKYLEKTIRKAIFENDLLDDPNIVIALSGGKDSLTLLYLLAAISGRGINKLNLTAIHVEGEVSCGANIDKSFLSAICKDLNIEFVSVSMPKMNKDFDCYICSRIRRKLIFEKAKQMGISTIAFGHHRDDNIQTLLMNLFQKGEFAAMLPKLKMYAYEVTIIRPLIYASEEDIRSFAKYYSFERITCKCPKGIDSRRKKMEDIIQSLEALYPSVRNNLSLAAKYYGSKKATNKSEKILQSITLKKKTT